MWGRCSLLVGDDDLDWVCARTRPGPVTKTARVRTKGTMVNRFTINRRFIFSTPTTTIPPIRSSFSRVGCVTRKSAPCPGQNGCGEREGVISTPLGLPLLGGTRLSGPPIDVGSPISLQRARRACPSDSPFRPIISEGRDCRVRRSTLDYPSRFNGHDERAPPISEGPACRVRCVTFDHPSRFRGHDKRAPPISEGRAFRVRKRKFDNPFHFIKYNRRANPNLPSRHQQI